MSGESAAIRDVLAERRKQIEKGYTAEHDDDHPLDRILGYGGFGKWTTQSYSQAEHRRTRAALVRMAACIVAGIEWLDRDASRRFPSESVQP